MLVYFHNGFDKLHQSVNRSKWTLFVNVISRTVDEKSTTCLEKLQQWLHISRAYNSRWDKVNEVMMTRFR